MTKEEIKNILENLNDDLVDVIRDKNFSPSNKKNQINELTDLIYSKPKYNAETTFFLKIFYM